MYRIVSCLALVLTVSGVIRASADEPAAQEPTAEVASSSEVTELQAAPVEGAASAADSDVEASQAHGASTDSHSGTHAAGGHAADEHGDHHGGHHDPYDLSHVNAGPQLEDPSQFKSDLAIWTVVVFFCLLAILGKFAWGPVMDGLERREHAIAAMIEEARLGQERAALQLQEYEAKLAKASEEARELITQARKDAEAAKERIVAEAQQVAQRERQRALDDIRAAKNVALEEISTKGVDLAVNLAGRIVRQQLRPEDHAHLIREALDQFPSRN